MRFPAATAERTTPKAVPHTDVQASLSGIAMGEN